MELCKYCRNEVTERNWTLDRLNNNIGHIATNCVLCCEDCNKAKSNKPFWEFSKAKKQERINKNSVICLIEDPIVVNAIKMNIVGGPSIVYCRHHKSGETEIKKHHTYN